MQTSRLCSTFCLCLGLLINGAGAQTAYTIKRTVFKNPGNFTQQQLEAVAQVHAGDRADAKVLGAAVQRLIDSGYFDNVQANFDGTAANTQAVFTLTPTPPASMIYVGFENFVWLTHDQIETAIHAKLPLFNDRLVENTAQVDAVNAVLAEALAAKGITATVTHDSVEPTLLHPERTLVFRVEKPDIRVANIHLAGVTPELKPLVQKSVNGTAHKPYNDGPAGHRTADSILAPLLDAGYADAALTGLSLDPALAPDGNIALVLSGTLVPGGLYHVAHIVYAGAPLLSPATFAAAQKLHDGDIASRELLLDSLAPIDTAYRERGYTDVIVDSAPALNRVAHTVAYNITVTPGEQYHVKSIQPTGLDATAQADFDRLFTMKAGTVYTPYYFPAFLKNNPTVRSFTGYDANWKAYADPTTHTVDLLINFFKVHQ